ncbi:MAG: class II aldolase/adducin family protein [Syntrophomonadaceae bacterium]|jgi:L-fuculose-phosphate aldolase
MIHLKERKDVMNTAQQIFFSKLVSGTWGNVSVRIPGEELMAITPSGMAYDTLTVEDMVLVDMNGVVQEGNWKPSIETAMHTQIYRNRPDVNAIVHVHSLYATIFAVAGKNIPVVTEETAQVIGHEIEVAAYAICGSHELAVNTIAALGLGRAVLLANHGLIGVGNNTQDAVKVCMVAEKSAQIALGAHQLGQVNSLSPADISVLNNNYKTYGQSKK